MVVDRTCTAIAQILSGIISAVKNPEGGYTRKGILTLTGILSRTFATPRTLTTTIKIFSGIYAYIKDTLYAPHGFLTINGGLTRIFSISKLQGGIACLSGIVQKSSLIVRTYSSVLSNFSGIVKFAELNTHRKGNLIASGSISNHMTFGSFTIGNNAFSGFSGTVMRVREILYYGPANP